MSDSNPTGSGDVINLPNLKTNHVHEFDDHYLIQTDTQSEPTVCPACRHSGFYRHGHQNRRFTDIPIHGKHVLIQVKRRRYRCASCSKTLFCPLPDMDGKRSTTKRLIQYLENHCLKHTFSSLARNVGIDERTVRHVFDDYLARMSRSVNFETPEILGIHEIKMIGHYRSMIANVEKCSIYDLAPTSDLSDLLIQFKCIPNPDKVRVVTVDPISTYREATERYFPGRLIVANKSNVLRFANHAMERTRKAVRKSLNTRTRSKLKDDRVILSSPRGQLTAEQKDKLEAWYREFPSLGAAYYAKEAFYDLYTYENRSTAELATRDLIGSIPIELTDHFYNLLNLFHIWWTEIFNWYEHPIENSYTVSVEHVTDHIHRVGRGYNFEAIRARLLLEEKSRIPTRSFVHMMPATRPRGDTSNGLETTKLELRSGHQEPVEEYGPHIPTLGALLETGYFD